MAQFYNPNRNENWNYGGSKWRLSRSKIDLFVECPRCFYIDNKLGTARTKPFPMNLNNAVYTLLKKEFDIYRKSQKSHPLMEKFGIDAIPFKHPDLNKWRENFEGIDFFHEQTGMTICGAVDDLWINPRGELHVVDYKSTSKDEKVNIDAEWQKSYKRQMEVYQWLLRKNGFDVSDTGYFVYANAKTDSEKFDAKLEFDIDIIPYENGNTDWVEDTIFKIKETLDSDEIPIQGSDCDHCAYHYRRDDLEKEDVIN